MIFTLQLLLVFASTYSTLACSGLLLQCPPGWTAFDASCYRFFNNPKLTWASAESHCNTFSFLSGTGHLTSVNSEAENDFLNSWWKTMRGGNDSVWIGYTDQESEGAFVGTEGCSPKFTNWKNNGQPNNSDGNQNCATIMGGGNRGKWNDIKCSDEKGFFCKISL